MEFSAKVIESAKEIFSTMVMTEISQDGDLRDDAGPLDNSISGVIGLAGTHKGVLAIHIPDKVAMAITGSFLGMEVEEMNEDVDDAVGELANMLGGNVKSILSEKGRDIDLSLPSTIRGKQYDFQPSKDVDKFVIPFTSALGNFLVEMQLEI